MTKNDVMNNLLEIMDKESCGKSEVYLYEEGGRWYAYHLVRPGC